MLIYLGRNMTMNRKIISNCTWPAAQRVYRNENRRLLSTPVEQAKPLKAMPGLTSLPIIGSLHHFLPVIGKVGPADNFFGLTDRLYKSYGTVVKLEGVFARATMVLLFEPEHFDQVYRAEDVLPLRPGFETLVNYRTELRKDTFEGVYGLTTAQGQDWRHFRTKVNPAFLKPKLVKLYEPALDEIAKDVVARLAKVKEDSKYLEQNFDLEMTRFALEAVGLIGLGARIGCLRDDLPEDHPGRQLIKCSKDILDMSFKLEFGPPFWKYLLFSTHKELIKTLDIQWEISSKFIQQAKNEINEREHDVPDEDKSIIEKLLAVDEKVAVMMANEMLMAGIDTVAFVTTALLYELAANPKVQDKLREQIGSGDLNKRYLKACLKECLRLHPVVAANLRRTSKEHVVGGYVIPEGVDVIAPNEYLSRMEKYYPRPLEFIPERWLAEKSDPLYYGNVHPMVTLPFGFGIRSCIGRRVAELEIETFVQRLIKEYQVKWEGPPLKTVTRVMNSFKKPYYFKFESVK